MTLVSDVFKVEIMPLIHRYGYHSYTGDTGLCPESTYVFTINNKYTVFYNREFADPVKLKDDALIFEPGNRIVITHTTKTEGWVIDIDWKTNIGEFYYEDVVLKNTYGYPEYKKHDDFYKIIPIRKVVCNELHKLREYRPTATLYD